MPTIRLAKTLSGQTSTIAMTPIDDDKLAMVLAINGRTTDTDVAEFDSTELRDAALAKCVADMTAAGFKRYADTPQAVDTEYCGDTTPIRLSHQILVF